MDNIDGADGHWVLRLYVVGQNHKCRTALANLKALCKSHLDGQYSIEVVDLLENPRLAQEHQIIAVPTLVRKLAASLRKLVGDLSDEERTLVRLQLQPALVR